MIISLYTCKSGIGLFKRGMSFGAWEKNARSFDEAEDNIEITVDRKDIEKVTNEHGAYRIVNVNSVKIIE